ncbi:SWI/SNF-related matrix-associated actin-dependent regulator of chromatin subfamily A-like protein 1 homolog [Durusdinium trenchii]|uniref:SWI/SNF-related matrix-associated actin-dependent regulator of chromatin subfamily A-like protein 1 homolog n=1 Tax=Durusdinium trenchii TaxID=1381693 RepID=A0ABP0IWL3_9DINO
MAEPASEADFVQLRVCQLKAACKARGLETAGNKAQLTARLVEHGGSLKDEVLALRQTYAGGSPIRVQSKLKSKKTGSTRRATGPKICHEDFCRLLLAIEDGSFRCSCGESLRHRNGRFGLFLICGCGHIERLEKAVARMQVQDLEDPVTLTVELESFDMIRVHAKGARDCGQLRAWAEEAQFGEPVQDWEDPSWVFYGAEVVARSGRVERVGYVFDHRQMDMALERLKAVTDRVEHATGKRGKLVRVDQLPVAAAQYLHGKSWMPTAKWAAQVLDDADRCWRDWTSKVQLSGEELMNLFRQRSALWERDLVQVAVAAGVATEEELDWQELLRREVSNPPDATFQLASREAKRLCQAALSRASCLSRLRNFQWEGVRRALELGGRCLIADEMGCGKSAQALGVVAAYDLWPVLIICPACMRLVWAEELEIWLPAILQPRHVHVIYSSNDMLPANRDQGGLGDIRVVIVSYAMARLLFENLSKRPWRLAIVDESHALRMINGKAGQATRAVLELLKPIPRVLLLSGTPSRSNYLDIFTQANLLRPGLLGESFHSFARDYDEPILSSSSHLLPGRCRRSWQLALLLRDAIMVRRRKSQVLEDLPPKHRRLVRLALTAAASGLCEAETSASTDFERCGLLKLVAAESWLKEKLVSHCGGGQKAVVFAHHIRVLDRLCRVMDLDSIRIDGSTPPITRQSLLSKFMSKNGPSLAFIGVTACAVGVDLSAASLAIFVELPPDASWLLQAEDRLHRHGQRQAVDILLLLAATTPSDRAAQNIQMQAAPPLTGSRVRFNPTITGDEAKALPRCEVSVRYTQGRLGGHTLKFFQPISDGRLLCLECLKPCEAHTVRPELVTSFTASDGEHVTHQASSTETDLFCAGSCRARFFGKRNESSLRRQLFDLERGVCQKCGADCHDLWQTLLASSPERRKKRLEEVAPGLKSPSKVTEGSLWQADHVVPVWRGGGLCGLENLQTLCTACHSEKTKKEAQERKEGRRCAKPKLKMVTPQRPAHSRTVREKSKAKTAPKISQASLTWDRELKGKRICFDLTEDEVHLEQEGGDLWRHRGTNNVSAAGAAYELFGYNRKRGRPAGRTAVNFQYDRRQRTIMEYQLSDRPEREKTKRGDFVDSKEDGSAVLSLCPVTVCDSNVTVGQDDPEEPPARGARHHLLGFSNHQYQREPSENPAGENPAMIAADSIARAESLRVLHPGWWQLVCRARWEEESQDGIGDRTSEELGGT